jgi:hypothetical protein
MMDNGPKPASIVLSSLGYDLSLLSGLLNGQSLRTVASIEGFIYALATDGTHIKFDTKTGSLLITSSRLSQQLDLFPGTT